ncbi:urease accessory protein UreD [Aneurinibacillus terranovensis]|uniref:urease accessory protein UreD n=1 Tax=Aneurinibacillus terranovensis TaxID=278991 RepID=UPI000429F00B|nr:urease accessory protein UreD [Aneurinibacillus terranovensis]
MNGVWRGRVASVGGRSLLIDSYHRSPLKIAKPFAGPDGELLLYLMDSSPGLFNGDVQELECTVEKGASLFLTNQSSCKLHPSVIPAESYQSIRFYVNEGANLEYFPEPVVPYSGACFRSDMEVHLDKGGQAIIADILTPGRSGRGECFMYERIMNRVSIFWDNKLAAYDAFSLEPGTSTSLEWVVGFYTHIGTLWVLSERIGEKHIELMRKELSAMDGSIYSGVSMLARNGLVIKMFGHSAEQLRQAIESCWAIARRFLFQKGALSVRK